MLKYDPETFDIQIEGVSHFESQKILLASKKELDVLIKPKNDRAKLRIFTPIDDIVQINKQEIILRPNNQNLNSLIHYDFSKNPKDREICNMDLTGWHSKDILEKKVWFLKNDSSNNKLIYNAVAKKTINNKQKTIVYKNIYESSSQNHYLIESYFEYKEKFYPIYIWINLLTNIPFQIYSVVHKHVFQVNEEDFENTIQEITNEIKRTINEQEDIAQKENVLPIEIHNVDLALSRKNVTVQSRTLENK